MTNGSLAKAYLQKATARVDVLELLCGKQAWSDVVRESQEIVELALKGMLRYVGVEPPKWHDVGEILREHRDKFPAAFAGRIDAFAEWSAILRERRELSLYGNESTGQDADDLYGRPEAEEALEWAREIVAAVKVVQPG